MKKNKVSVTKSFRETKDLGFEIAKILKPGDKIFLYGDLGSGKTTFVQGLAKGLGIQRRIISPTFVIVRNYRIKNFESRILNFYHIDLYRIENEKDIGSLGIEEILNDKSGIVVIEWGERMEKYLPDKRIDIKFAYLKNNKRKISICSKY